MEIEPKNEKEKAWMDYLLYLYDLATKHVEISGKSHREEFNTTSLLLFRLTQLSPDDQKVVIKLMEGGKEAELLEIEMQAIKEGKIYKG